MDKNSVTTVAVTGATGFIGGALVTELIREDGVFVKVLVRDRRKTPAAWLQNKRVKVVEGDLHDSNSLSELIKNAAVVYHMAAVLRIYEKNGELQKTNIDGLVALLNAITKSSQKVKLIFASSIDATRSKSDYAKSKLRGEKLLLEVAKKKKNIEPLIVRFGNVGQAEEGVLAGVEQIIKKNNWQSHVLYYLLGNKFIYHIEKKALIKQLVKMKNTSTGLKVAELFGKEVMIKDSVAPPKKNLLAPVIFEVWKMLAKITKRGDLLIYFSLRNGPN